MEVLRKYQRLSWEKQALTRTDEEFADRYRRVMARLSDPALREFVEREVEPQAAEHDRLERFNHVLFRRAGDLGLLGVTVAEEDRKADPTGVGDAFRAGYLSGQAWGLSDERSAQLGALLATYVIETIGTQEYELARTHFLERMART